MTGSTKRRAHVPTYSSTPDPNCHFALLQCAAFLDLLEGWFRFGDPELVIWVCIDADVRFGGDGHDDAIGFFGSGGGHDGHGE